MRFLLWGNRFVHRGCSVRIATVGISGMSVIIGF